MQGGLGLNAPYDRIWLCPGIDDHVTHVTESTVLYCEMIDTGGKWTKRKNIYICIIYSVEAPRKLQC